MEELVKKIEELRDWELLEAYKAHGPHTSRHQAEGVLREEVEESQEELKEIKDLLEMVWECVKHDESAWMLLDCIIKSALNLAAEAIQVSAMAQKFIDYENSKKE